MGESAIASDTDVTLLALFQHRLVEFDVRLVLGNFSANKLDLLLGVANGSLDGGLVRLELSQLGSDLRLVVLGGIIVSLDLLLGDVEGRFDPLQLASGVTVGRFGGGDLGFDGAGREEKLVSTE